MSAPPPGPAMMTNSPGFDGCHAASAVGRERRTVPGPRTPRKSPTISEDSQRFFLYMGCPPVKKRESEGPMVVIGHRRHWGEVFLDDSNTGNAVSSRGCYKSRVGPCTSSGARVTWKARVGSGNDGGAAGGRGAGAPAAAPRPQGCSVAGGGLGRGR